MACRCKALAEDGKASESVQQVRSSFVRFDYHEHFQLLDIMNVFFSKRSSCWMLGEILFGFQLSCGTDNGHFQSPQAPSMMTERPFQPRPISEGSGRNNGAIGGPGDQIDLDCRAVFSQFS